MSAIALPEPPEIATSRSPFGPDVFFEVVGDRVVEQPPMGANEVLVAFRLAVLLDRFATEGDLGQAVAEMMFDLGPAVNRKRRPDVAFVSFERWAKGRKIPPGDAWGVIPDLAIEVVSPNDGASELLAKIDEYFRAGVRAVWVVYTEPACVYLYDAFADVRILTAGATIDGGAVLPGFTLPLATLLGS